MWVHITVLGQASWRCVQCRAEVGWQAYLVLEANTGYAMNMIMPPMPAAEPGAEPPTTTDAASSATPGH
eukprot:6585754-Heterocapsa_arctica.AAC.1